MITRRALQMLAAAPFALAALVSSVSAGTITVSWDAVSDADLQGYRVYYGTSAGAYPSYKYVAAPSVSTTLDGLDACTRYYIAVKAYDGAAESTEFSNELSGLPRPVVSAVSPTSAEQGAALTLTITGESFDANATVEIAGSGVAVQAVRRDACGQLSVDVRIDLAAPTGARDVTVTNPDRSYGVRAAAFSVAANTAPTISSSNPAAGATAVAVTIDPQVTFSEAMDPATVTATTVRLLNASGAVVTQAAGSPALSADGRTATITPAANLAHSATHRITVMGGSSGVKDRNGKPLASDWQQNPGFTTAEAPDTTAPTVTGVTPADGATNVAVGVHPQVQFSEALDPGSVTATTVQLLDSTGAQVPQATGSPALAADRTTVTVTPAATLTERQTYKIRVLGGGSGVKDAAGNALASTWTATNGFTTENRPPVKVLNLRRTDTR